MRTFRIVLIVLATLLMAITAIYFDYSNCSWQANRSNYLVLITGVLVIISNIAANKSDSKRK
jgi:hypothetical protein